MNWKVPFMDQLLGAPLHRVVYLSHARAEHDLGTLRRYCNGFASANAVLGITGLLIHGGGHFLQVLEGETPVMRGLLRRIFSDSRHDGIKLLLEEDSRTRLFPKTAMGLLDLGDPAALAAEDCEALRGFIEHAAHADHAPTARVLEIVPQMLRRLHPQAA